MDDRVTALDVLAFGGELVLLAGLAVAGARLLDGVGGTTLAVALPLLLAVVWGRWLAPRAARPVGLRARLVLKTALVVVTAGLLAASGLVLLGTLVLVGVGTVLVVAELHGRTGRTRGGAST